MECGTHPLQKSHIKINHSTSVKNMGYMLDAVTKSFVDWKLYCNSISDTATQRPIRAGVQENEGENLRNGTYNVNL